jgi:hypothetical protein
MNEQNNNQSIKKERHSKPDEVEVKNEDVETTNQSEHSRSH